MPSAELCGGCSTSSPRRTPALTSAPLFWKCQKAEHFELECMVFLCSLFWFWKEFIPDIARRCRQTDAAWLAPNCLVNFMFVADCQTPGRFRRHKDRVAHFSA